MCVICCSNDANIMPNAGGRHSCRCYLYIDLHRTTNAVYSQLVLCVVFKLKLYLTTPCKSNTCTGLNTLHSLCYIIHLIFLFIEQSRLLITQFLIEEFCSRKERTFAWPLYKLYRDQFLDDLFLNKGKYSDTMPGCLLNRTCR